MRRAAIRMRIHTSALRLADECLVGHRQAGGTVLDDRGLQSLPCLLRDMFTARHSHGGENHNEVLVIKPLNLDEVDDVLHVLKERVARTMLVGLVHGIRQEARGGRAGGQLIEVPGQDLRGHPTPGSL